MSPQMICNELMIIESVVTDNYCVIDWNGLYLTTFQFIIITSCTQYIVCTITYFISASLISKIIMYIIIIKIFQIGVT